MLYGPPLATQLTCPLWAPCHLGHPVLMFTSMALGHPVLMLTSTAPLSLPPLLG